MPLAIDRDQQLILAHRENFFGKPTGPSTVSWDYTGQAHQVRRPEDGHPARQWQVGCGVCGKRLEFTVHSVQATRRRQAVRRAWAWAGLAVLVGSVAGCFVIGGDALPFLIAAAVVGAAIGWYVGVAAADQMGVTGHGAGMPIVAKHAVTLVESRPADRPELVCEKCGHQEETPFGSHYRKGWLDKQHQAAKERMDAHTCRGS
ncbi:hypothetical protein [Streptosporangium sp. KLBMP 9127]|nr:hypothetical protein [Streptosporangium sp. KLBMP 9127]